MTEIERSTGEASGKVILFGEHAVVHGAPAIAAGIDRAVRAAAIRSKRASSTLRMSHREILAHVSASDDLGRALHALLKVAPALSPVEVEAWSDLPAGGGLGSSAALGVAISRAVQGFAETNSRDTDAVTLERSAAWERIFHGNPSGIDAMAASRGGIFRYSRADGATSLHPSKDIVLCVGWSGAPSSTRAMVELIAARLAKDPDIVNKSIAAIHSIVDAATTAIQAGDHVAIGQLMNMNQHVLSGLMVSTSEIEELCALAREHGALGAKLTGGGGGGSVIALVPPSFTTNGEADLDREGESAQQIIKAWRKANQRYGGFVTRIHADKPSLSTTAIEGAAP